MPVLRQSGNDLRRPDPPEHPTPFALPLNAQFEPSARPEVDAQPIG